MPGLHSPPDVPWEGVGTAVPAANTALARLVRAHEAWHKAHWPPVHRKECNECGELREALAQAKAVLGQ